MKDAAKGRKMLGISVPLTAAFFLFEQAPHLILD